MSVRASKIRTSGIQECINYSQSIQTQAKPSEAMSKKEPGPDQEAGG